MLKFSSRFEQKLKNSDPVKIDNSYIEFAIFALFRINLIECIKVKVALAKQFHIQPSELDRMYFWEYEIFIMQLNDMVKDENESQQAELDKYHVGEYMNMARPGNISKMINKSQPKMPSIPNINISAPKM